MLHNKVLLKWLELVQSVSTVTYYTDHFWQQFLMFCHSKNLLSSWIFKQSEVTHVVFPNMTFLSYDSIMTFCFSKWNTIYSLIKNILLSYIRIQRWSKFRNRLIDPDSETSYYTMKWNCSPLQFSFFSAFEGYRVL